jgi:hypothetical protein
MPFFSQNQLKKKKVPKTKSATLLSQQIIVDTQPNESQITL